MHRSVVPPKMRLWQTWPAASSTAQVWSGTADTSASSYEEYDAYGRLTSVKESAAPGGAQTTTDYTYDVGSRLIAVRMTEPGGAVQNRIFDYDGRGFLRWESQPESGMKTYTYDARGHVLTAELGAARTSLDLKYQYDAAERLTRIEARDPANLETYRVIKTFEYGTANGLSPADHRLGKLQTATRYNYEAPGFGNVHQIFRVAETYEYKDSAGRRTDRTTNIAASSDLACCWQATREIKQSQAYDDLGRSVLMNYPMCIDCGAPGGNPARALTSTYTHDRLTSMSDFVSSVTYWPNGMRNTLVHSNGMADEQTVHSSKMTRPGTLKFGMYTGCQTPAISSQTIAAVGAPGESVLLSVTATGTAPLSYAWFNADTDVSLGATGPTVEVTPASTARYYVRVSNACRSLRSKTITVKVGECVDPWIYDHSVTKNPNGTFTLSVSAHGSGTLSYSWRRLPDNAIVGNAATLIASVTSSTSYEVTVSNACGGAAATQQMQAFVDPVIPLMSISAERSASGQVTVRWGAVTGATSYVVTRKAGAAGGTYVFPSMTAVEYIDGSLPTDKAYVYSVEAQNASGQVVGRSSGDLATTLAFSPLSATTIVSAAHWTELLNAVNAVRSYVGWRTVAWADIISPADPLPVPGSTVMEAHLLTLRARLNEVLQVAGFAVNGYAETDLRTKPIRAQHIMEIRERVR